MQLIKVLIRNFCNLHIFVSYQLISVAIGSPLNNAHFDTNADFEAWEAFKLEHNKIYEVSICSSRTKHELSRCQWRLLNRSWFLSQSLFLPFSSLTIHSASFFACYLFLTSSRRQRKKKRCVLAYGEKTWPTSTNTTRQIVMIIPWAWIILVICQMRSLLKKCSCHLGCLPQELWRRGKTLGYTPRWETFTWE